MNGVDISRFPFEYDLTWMSFFQNAAGRTYLRYGGRNDHDSESHLNQKSLVRAMRQTLALHRDNRVQPINRYEPAPQEAFTPEAIPTMAKMLSKRKEKCIHCHDVKGARLKHQRELGRLDKKSVHTYPSPENLGMVLDPEIQYQVKRVTAYSPAAAAGLQAGDLVRQVAGQRVLTYGDVTRVLELAPESGSLPVTIERNRQKQTVELSLPPGWRTSVDPSWRGTTGVLGPSAGVWGKKADSKQRRNLGLGEGDLAIRVTFIWAAWAKQAKIRHGDYIVSVDGKTHDMTIRQLQAYLHLNRNWGDTTVIEVVRNKQRLKLTFQFPKQPPY